MIIVAQSPIDLTLYLNVGLLWMNKHPTPNVWHLDWPKCPPINAEWEREQKKGCKLYVTAHGSGKKVGAYEPNDLATMLTPLIEFVPFTKVVLLSCGSGKEVDFGGDIGNSTYCQVFADKYELDTKKKIEVTGFDGDHTTRPDGKSRAMDPLKNSVLKMLISTTLDTEKDDKLEKKVLRNTPQTPQELIDKAVKVSKKWLTFITEPDTTWPKVYETHKSKSNSKVSINKV
jgi:hypothetical protein